MGKGDEFRSEEISSQTVQVPKTALWGGGTAVAVSKLAVSGQAPHAKLVDAMLVVKKACALANAEHGLLDSKVSAAIASACDDLHGNFRENIVVDAFAPADYLNVNVNEVIANRAGQILGQELGTYKIVHPERQVNCSQSTTDVYPTAARLAILLNLRDMEASIMGLERLLRRKSLEFEKVIKPGRLHLQDSLPISLGQELNAYGSSVQRGYMRINESSQRLLELAIGATTIGTGVNSTAGLAHSTTRLLSQFSGCRFFTGDDYFRLSQSANDFLEFSSALKELAVELTRITNDLRLLASGPAAGFNEVSLPPVLATASVLLPGIMPVRNNPDLPESLNMVCYQVMGNDMSVMLACQSGQLESNPMLPLVVHNLLNSMDLLKGGLTLFNQHCVSGITANQNRCQDLLQATGVITYALAEEIGLEKAALIFQESLRTGKTVREIALDKELISAENLERILHYKSLAKYTHQGLLKEIASATTYGGTDADNP